MRVKRCGEMGSVSPSLHPQSEPLGADGICVPAHVLWPSPVSFHTTATLWDVQQASKMGKSAAEKANSILREAAIRYARMKVDKVGQKGVLGPDGDKYRDRAIVGDHALFAHAFAHPRCPILTGQP